MQVLVDFNKPDPNVGGDKYIESVVKYYEENIPFVVYGTMKNTGKLTNDSMLKDDALIDYYLTEINYKSNRANFEWSRTCIAHGIHRWEPVKKDDTLHTMSNSRRALFWLPVYYTKPMHNKTMKHILQTIEG